MLRITDLFDLSRSLAGDWLAGFEYPHEALSGIPEFIRQLGARLPLQEYSQPSPEVWVHNTAVVFPSALVGGPCIIGPGSQIRHGAYIRESALIGADCVVGTACELKNVILFDGVQVPHYNYVGDSILGYKAHMGAGAVTSNVKSDRSLVTVKTPEETIHTGRKKFGAILGDHAEIGCNSVLNPGTIIGRNTQVYPLTMVRGTIPPDCILKQNGSLVAKNKS